MPKNNYSFNWTSTGVIIIKADNLEEAKEEFEKIPDEELKAIILRNVFENLETEYDFVCDDNGKLVDEV